MTPNIQFPRVAWIEQSFPRPQFDVTESNIYDLLKHKIAQLDTLQDKRIAITAGSRGISNIDVIVKTLVRLIRDLGGRPFIIPAMGSHGGGTPEGQLQILADYDITPEKMGAPILASIETVQIGQTEDHTPVYVAKAAWESDGIIALNRIKPHTDFVGEIESGLLKIITVGLGKVDGAQTFHSRTADFAYDYLIQTIAEKTIASGKILCGIALLENAYHETASLEIIPPDQIPTREKELLLQAKEWMPSLPVDQADVLIIEQIGKDISGVGMDPNITGRRYNINTHWQDKPDITRIVVMDISEKSMGNAVGIGLADFCSRKVIDKMDKRVTYLNAVTSRNTICSNIPLHFETDREMLEQTLISLGDIPAEKIRLLRIRDTLHLTRIEVSEALIPEMKQRSNISAVSALHELEFDKTGGLMPSEI
ncbi:MAG: lactate racemase domain-containing protein [Candidatus Hinthialibacter sp.]